MFTHEYIGTSFLFSPSLDQITIRILSPGTVGVMLQGSFAIPPCTASISYTALAENKKKIWVCLLSQITWFIFYAVGEFRINEFLEDTFPKEKVHRFQIQRRNITDRRTEIFYFDSFFIVFLIKFNEKCCSLFYSWAA